MSNGSEMMNHEGTKTRRSLRALQLFLRGFVASWLVLFVLDASVLADDSAKPKVAVFPIAGDADEKLRERVGFSLRSKLDREGTYEAVSGVEMTEALGKEKVDFSTATDSIEKIAQPLAADVGIWGDLSGKTLKVKVFDFRQLDPLPFEIKQDINEPTDVRFVSEKVLEHLADVRKFTHMTEEAVAHDATADELWETNPNLVVNGDFTEPGKWERLYMSERHEIKTSSALPERDKIVIYSITDADGTPNNVLAMNLSRTAAENNGLAALSQAITVEPATRYRLQFRYNSAAPVLHVFVKGYTLVKDGQGGTVEREIYRRQVPVTGGTDGKWVTIVDDLNPQHVTFPVQLLRVDLYAYLQPGLVMFDDVVLKAVGGQTRKATDAAIDMPTTRPSKRSN